MRVTRKQRTPWGKVATPASEKQIKFATDILLKINEDLDKIESLGFGMIANEIAEELDRRTTFVDVGARDVITYLQDVNAIKECYRKARAQRNFDAVDVLQKLI